MVPENLVMISFSTLCLSIFTVYSLAYTPFISTMNGRESKVAIAINRQVLVGL